MAFSIPLFLVISLTPMLLSIPSLRALVTDADKNFTHCRFQHIDLVKFVNDADMTFQLSC